MPGTPTLFRIKNFEVTEDFFMKKYDELMGEISQLRAWGRVMGGKKPETLGRIDKVTGKTVLNPWPTDPLRFVNTDLNEWARSENLSDSLKLFIKIKDYF